MARRSVVVSNPYANPEISHAAAALARTHALGRYHVPIDRSLPSGVEREVVTRTSGVTAYAFLAAGRMQLPANVQFRLTEAHRSRFDRQVARSLTGACDAVVAVQGSALSTLRRAQELGVRAVLDATLPEPRLVADRIAEERRARPGEARDLTGDVPPASWTDRREAELEHVDLILTPSTFARDTYVAAGIDPGRVAVTPLGVDLELFVPPVTRSTEHAFRVIFVGRISQAKGVGHLVAAFRRLAIPGGELVLVGDVAGSGGEMLCGEGIRHLPRMGRAELAGLLRSASVFVFPTLADSFGLVALEAMACGLPVILSEDSLGRDAVTDGVDGFVVAIRDADAIAERLFVLAENLDLRRAMGAAARKRAEAFPWIRYEEQILKVLL